MIIKYKRLTLNIICMLLLNCTDLALKMYNLRSSSRTFFRVTTHLNIRGRRELVRFPNSDPAVEIASYIQNYMKIKVSLLIQYYVLYNLNVITKFNIEVYLKYLKCKRKPTKVVPVDVLQPFLLLLSLFDLVRRQLSSHHLT